MDEEMENKKIVNISKNTFISVVIILFILILMSIGLTYFIPKGIMIDNNYQVIEDASGIAIWKGLLSPFLVLGSSDGVTLIALCIFLMIKCLGHFYIYMHSHTIAFKTTN